MFLSSEVGLVVCNDVCPGCCCDGDIIKAVPRVASFGKASAVAFVVCLAVMADDPHEVCGGRADIVFEVEVLWYDAGKFKRARGGGGLCGSREEDGVELAHGQVLFCM